MNKDGQRAKLEEIALRMYVASIGWHYDALERLTAPNPPTFDRLRILQRIPEPTPFERGVLARYQDRKRG